MNPLEIVRLILKDRTRTPIQQMATTFAPINIALLKYWGKRDPLLNLPVTDSLSLTLPEWGTHTSLEISATPSVWLNDLPVGWNTLFGQRIQHFLALFELSLPLQIKTSNTIPMSAGVASSSSGFAALVKALNALCEWGLDPTQMSLLARLGSGSACRSFWPGFVLWQAGQQAEGLDSHGVSLVHQWSELRVGIVLIDAAHKPVGSREAMLQTQQTSPYYRFWPQMVATDLLALQKALQQLDFSTVGTIIERQALSLHWLMGTSEPPIVYTQPNTIEAIQQIHALRRTGHLVYWTQDAGPNLKLFFLEKDQAAVLERFPDLRLSCPFALGLSPFNGNALL